MCYWGGYGGNSECSGYDGVDTIFWSKIHRLHYIGSLRNRGGDAHAGRRSRVAYQARHAALTVNLAGSMALFLIETWQAQSEKTDRSEQ
ncbi:abortive infection family protein [Cohaesibacter marisflavi]|uniref:abortive infection family protein n=1 Tax=Cohaesibacter marisflavi TaxID=655353 RepID=UPI0038993231